MLPLSMAFFVLLGKREAAGNDDPLASEQEAGGREEDVRATGERISSNPRT